MDSATSPSRALDSVTARYVREALSLSCKTTGLLGSTILTERDSSTYVVE